MHRLVSLPVLLAVSALSACSNPDPKPAEPIPMEAFLKLLADPQTVDFAFERHAFADTDREGLGHLTAGKITRFVGNPNYSCYVVEGQAVEGQEAMKGQKAAAALARYRICWVSQPLMRIADVDRLK